MKICVYAIAKNEEQFVRRFCESAQDADLILIADTGSTDRTVEIARNCGAQVHEICISPWRFDHARNAALALVPRDIDVCVSIDLDEVLEPGWREEIERVWKDGATRLRYLYDWGSGVRFFYEKIHARHGYHWHHPCHEYPRADARILEKFAETDRLLVTHHPDSSKERGQYLDLLEMSVKEDPSCPRNAFYYARELHFRGRHADAIAAAERYLAMPSATLKSERTYAYRVIGKCYAAMGDNFKAEVAFRKGIDEAPGMRDAYVDLAEFYYRTSNWQFCYLSAFDAIRITERTHEYTVDPRSWGSMPHDLAAIAAWNLGMQSDAVRHGEAALAIDPDDERLKTNLRWFKGEMERAA